MKFETMDREELKIRARRFQKGKEILTDFFNEIGGMDAGSDQLSMLMEVYVANAQVSQLDLANMVSFCNRLRKVFLQAAVLYADINAEEAEKVPGLKMTFEDISVKALAQRELAVSGN